MGDRKSPRVYTARGPAEDEDWAAVAAALNERMSARRIGQQQLAELSGVSVSTVRLLQHGSGRRVQNKTLAAVARALDWPDDHLVRVLTVSRPDNNPASTTAAGSEVVAALARLENRLDEVIEGLAAVERAIKGCRRPTT